jgi:uncharacterized protein (TIGR02246 family)
MKTRMAVLFPILIAVGCAGSDTAETGETAATADPSVVRQAIEQANAGLIAALKAGDPAQVASFYDAEAVAMPPNLPANRGQQEIVASLTRFFDYLTVTDFSLNIEDVIVKDDVAIETGNSTITVRPKQPAAPAMAPEMGKYLAVWKRQADGSWKKLRDIWNTDAPPPAGGS